MCSLTHSNKLFLKCVALSDLCWFMSVLLQSSLWRYTVTLMESHFRKYKAFLQESAYRDVRLYKLRHCILLSFWLDSYITEFLKAGNTDGNPVGEGCSESLISPFFWCSQRNDDCLLHRLVIGFSDTAPFLLYLYSEDIPTDLKGHK